MILSSIILSVPLINNCSSDYLDPLLGLPSGVTLITLWVEYDLSAIASKSNKAEVVCGFNHFSLTYLLRVFLRNILHKL